MESHAREQLEDEGEEEADDVSPMEMIQRSGAKAAVACFALNVLSYHISFAFTE